MARVSVDANVRDGGAHETRDALKCAVDANAIAACLSDWQSNMSAPCLSRGEMGGDAHVAMHVTRLNPFAYPLAIRW